MRRLALAACITAMVAAGCADQQLGRRVLECEVPTASISSTLILTAQAVPTADYLPCIASLRPGWDYHHVVAHKGEASFTIDSDRMGVGFLRVSLLPSCDTGDATGVASDEVGAELRRDVLEERIDISVVVIPVASRHEQYARSLAALLNGDTVNGRRVVGVVDASADPMSERIARAHAAGNPVLIVDDREVESATASLRRVGRDEQSGLGFERILDEIADDVEPPAYRARWFYTFDGGCIRYDIDAVGEGARSVARDVERAIGMYPMEELRELARDAGYHVFEGG